FRQIREDFVYLDIQDMSSEWDNYQKDQFYRDNLLCYEFVAPADLPRDEFFNRIIADLDEKFGVESSVESTVMRHGVVTMMPEFHLWEPTEESDDSERVSFFDRLGFVTYLSWIANRLDTSADFDEPIIF